MPGPGEGFPSQENNNEKLAALIEMEREFGFVETEKMIGIRNKFVNEPSSRKELYNEWTILAELEIEEIKDHVKGREALLGMHLGQARMLLSAGLSDHFNEMIQEEIDCISVSYPEEIILRLRAMKVQ